MPPPCTWNTAKRTAAHCRIELYQIKAALPRRRRPAASRACGLAAGPGHGGRLAAKTASGRSWSARSTLDLLACPTRSTTLRFERTVKPGHLGIWSPCCPLARATARGLHMPCPRVVAA